MPTDTERRDVAARLREIRPCKSGHIKWCEIARALGLKQPAGWFGWEKFEPDSVNRLADLIEPEPERTCRNLNPPSCRDFECSECGESSEFTPGFMPNYCPNCGARVVEEASDDADR